MVVPAANSLVQVSSPSHLSALILSHRFCWNASRTSTRFSCSATARRCSTSSRYVLSCFSRELNLLHVAAVCVRRLFSFLCCCYRHISPSVYPLLPNTSIPTRRSRYRHYPPSLLDIEVSVAGSHEPPIVEEKIQRRREERGRTSKQPAPCRCRGLGGVSRKPRAAFIRAASTIVDVPHLPLRPCQTGLCTPRVAKSYSSENGRDIVHWVLKRHNDSCHIVMLPPPTAHFPRLRPLFTVPPPPWNAPKCLVIRYPTVFF